MRHSSQKIPEKTALQAIVARFYVYTVHSNDTVQKTFKWIFKAVYIARGCVVFPYAV